jgi:hypothetical protein
VTNLEDMTPEQFRRTTEEIVMDATTMKALVRAGNCGDETARQALTEATGLVWDEQFRMFLPPGV